VRQRPTDFVRVCGQDYGQEIWTASCIEDTAAIPTVRLMSVISTHRKKSFAALHDSRADPMTPLSHRPRNRTMGIVPGAKGARSMPSGRSPLPAPEDTCSGQPGPSADLASHTTTLTPWHRSTPFCPTPGPLVEWFDCIPQLTATRRQLVVQRIVLLDESRLVKFIQSLVQHAR
jgi:hypothetical protein